MLNKIRRIEFIICCSLAVILFLSGRLVVSEKNESKVENISSDTYSAINTRIFPGSFIQVETSCYTNPSDQKIIIASAITNYNEGGYTTGFYKSTNNGMNWNGTDNINNSSGNTITTIGDPTVSINHNGNYILSYIAPSLTGGADLKLGVSYSTNNGTFWSPTVYISGVDTADKPISESDNFPSSAYTGRSYIAYDEIKSIDEETRGIYLSYSTNGGISWDTSRRITNINSLYKYRLISDISIGSTGDVFVLWLTNRKYMGLARSTTGGINWIMNNDTAINTDSTIITFPYNNVYLQGVPNMEIDNSGRVRNGWIYTVDLENNQDSLDIVLHRSTNNGVNWNYMKRVNQDTTGVFRIQTLPSMNVDMYGGINVFYCDTRNSVSNDSFEVYLSRSTDGGINFNDMKISDHKFKFSRPAVSLFGFDGYIGSYIGVSSGTDKITPVWYDNSSGIYQAYTASIELLPDYEIKLFPEGFYNTVNHELRMKDTLSVYLRRSVSPYVIVDSAKGIIDSVSFNASMKFNYDLNPGNYYLDIRHRNSIQTWSAFPVAYSFGSKVNYDFTSGVSKAFGDNMTLVNGKSGIYSGDVNQDGFIDLSDILTIFNESNNFLTGYVPQDCTGDSVVDLSDILIAYNNANMFVISITP